MIEFLFIWYSLFGFFYHPHKNEEKYLKNEFGGWSQNRPGPRKKKVYPRIENGLIYPLSARGMSKEEIWSKKRWNKNKKWLKKLVVYF